MNIIDYYNLLDSINNSDKKHNKFIQKNIFDIQITKLYNEIYYIKNNQLDNFYTCIIYKKNNKYTINIFFSVIRNDESISTIKLEDDNYNMQILQDKLKIYFNLTEIQINEINNFLEIH